MPNHPAGVVAIREAVRKEHLTTEANLRGVGCLWMLSIPMGIAVAASAVLPILGLAKSGTQITSEATGVVIPVVMGLVMLTQGVVGYQLRKLSPGARIPAIVFAVLGLLAFPIGSIISLFILILLCRPKGIRVLSPDYREVIEATPHIKYRTPTWIWVLLGLIVLALVAAVALPLVSKLGK